MVAQFLGVVNVLQPSRLSLCHSALFTGWFPLPREALRALFPSSSEHTHPTWVVRATWPSRSHPAACLLPTLKVAHWIAPEGLDVGCSMKNTYCPFRKIFQFFPRFCALKKQKVCLVSDYIRSCSSSYICLLLCCFASLTKKSMCGLYVGCGMVLPSSFRASSTYLFKKWKTPHYNDSRKIERISNC